MSRTSELVDRLVQAHWTVHVSHVSTGVKISASRQLPGGRVTIEVEGAGLEAVAEDVGKLCDAIVVTE